MCAYFQSGFDVGQPVDKRIELSSEIINLNQQIDSIKKLSKELNALVTLAINTIDANEKSLKALNAAVKSSENIVNGICCAITRAENTTIAVVLSPEDISELASHRKVLIEEERKINGEPPTRNESSIGIPSASNT